ncbi:MAG: type VI secretion system ATPase TssH [Planctomycetota bacterium]
MLHVDLKPLVGKLNETCRRTLEGAAALCLSRTNYNVEVEHWLFKLLETTDTDVAAALRHFEIDPSRVCKDVSRVLDGLKTGNARAPAFSQDTVDLIRGAWLVGSINFDAAKARTGHVLLALLSDDTLNRVIRNASPEFDKLSAEELRKNYISITARSSEAEESKSAPGAPTEGAKRPEGGGALDKYTIDLTARARRGEIDPVRCREAEIRQIVDILTRRRQNNPILTGEAGVGKTAVVEGFAIRVVENDVPPALRNVQVRTLDLGLLQAGAGIKGEFENRLKSVIEEVKASSRPVILFIDEAHTLIGAGGQAGQGDAANMLKPALARGELRTIAATTWAEYKKYFEKDAALARRFQVVKIEEPDEDSAIKMVRGLCETLEKHHNVRILDEAIDQAVRLSHRYLSGRQLPDKAISLIDTASARVAIGQSTVPPAVEECRWRIRHASLEIEILNREIAAGTDHSERLAEREATKAAAEAELKELEARWEKEAGLVAQIRPIRQQLEASVQPPAAATPAVATAKSPQPQAAQTPPSPSLTQEQLESLRGQLHGLEAQLKEIQGENPLMQVCVDGQAVAEVISGWTGIPVGRMVKDEIRAVLALKQSMQRRIVGQDHALEVISQSIRTSRAGLTDPRRPIGVFLLVGTSGTGKTETAITLAELLYGGEQNMTVINMSEFKEEHKVSLLMGSPPGYVGYGEGGVLTEAVRRRPYSVVLLDEIEKAHPGVQDIFYQVFDKGTLRDGEGRDIDFKNTVIMMTSNAGSDMMMSICSDPETRPSAEQLREVIHPELLKVFKPAFLGRINVVPFYPLTDEVLRRIVELQLNRIGRRVESTYRATFEYSPDLVNVVAARCTEVDTGARNIDHILSHSLLPQMSEQFLARMAEGHPIKSVGVSMSSKGEFEYRIE